ncbi:MAG TPA: hypothetical protein VK425_12170, partial [Acidimicrobiales bacterium]|nr:hypothetical protein [Acidimicrobiales bacterium]
PPSGRLRPLPRLPHPITWRVVGFVAAIAIVVGGALACLAWYARSSYFVTISAGRLAIFQGRPGGVLWFEPTLALRTGYSPSSVDAYWLQTLQAGQPEPSLNQAQLYINRLVSEKREAEAVTPPSAKGPPREHAAPPSPKARARNGAARQARSSRGRARASRTSA